MLEISTYNFKSRFQRLCAHLLVRFKYIKRVPFELNTVNQLVKQQLPQQLSMTIPGGTGELSILDSHFSVISDKSCLQVEVLCNFSVNVKKTVIYNTHLQLLLEVSPIYLPIDKMISLSNVKVVAVKLISDNYSVIKDTGNIIRSFLPKPLNSIINLTMSSTQMILNHKTINSVTQYLSLYSSGSKQIILDYHRADIEKKIIDIAKSKVMQYQLNESIFEEKLFSQYGKKISIEDNQLYFDFY